MSELSKCLQGKQFNCIDDELVSIITKARRLTNTIKLNLKIPYKKTIFYLNYLPK